MADIGVDFGGTTIKVAQVKQDRVLAEASVQTLSDQGPEAILSALARAVKELDPNPTAVGLAIPGQVDAEGACYRLPNVPGFEGFNISKFLEAHLDCPVRVENDANVAAHGEALYGLGRRYPSFALFTLGTGVGGGLVIDGRVCTGHYGFAAEIGHVIVDTRDDAWPCVCGRRGCVEVYAGTRGLLRRFHELGGNASEVLTIAESARVGETAGVQTFEMMAEALARTVTILQTLLDLDAIGFTGGVARSFDLIEPRLQAHVRAMAYAEPLSRVPLLASELGPRAGVIGAANLHRLLTPATTERTAT